MESKRNPGEPVSQPLLLSLIEPYAGRFEALELLWVIERRLSAATDSRGRHTSWERITHNFNYTFIRGGGVGRLSGCFPFVPGSKWPAATDFEAALSLRESARYPLNDGGVVLPWAVPDELPRAEDLCNEVLLIRDRIEKAYPHRRWRVTAERAIDEVCIGNTLGLRGAYARDSVVRRAETRDPQGRMLSFSLPQSSEEAGLVAACSESEESHAVPYVRIRSAVAPLLLAPGAVATLCVFLSRLAVSGEKWRAGPGDLSDAFELLDDPCVEGSSKSCPFDDEGTPTCAKTLFRGHRRRSVMNTLETAHLFGDAPSGNAFRRNAFRLRTPDTAVEVCPLNLEVVAGSTPSSEILNSGDDVIVVENFLVPFSELHGSRDSLSDVHAVGSVFSNGAPRARLAPATVRCRGSRSFPGVIRRFLGPSASICSDGAVTGAGWFPYVFQPEFRW